MKVFSFGGGVQSTAALILAARGELACDAFLFANVGDDSENPDTLRYVREVAMPYAEAHGLHIETLLKRRRDGRVETLYGKLQQDSRTIGIPALLGDSGTPARRNCTSDFKVQRVASWCWQHGARKSRPATVLLGISVDEAWRMRNDSGYSYTRIGYPLVERAMTRAACHRLITEEGLPTPPKSSCWFCPYHTRSAWVSLSLDHPDLFRKAIELEEMLSERARVIHAHRANYQGDQERVYLSSVRKPLPMVVAPGMQAALWEDDVCESGYCMV